MDFKDGSEDLSFLSSSISVFHEVMDDSTGQFRSFSETVSTFTKFSDQGAVLDICEQVVSVLKYSLFS